MSFKLLLGTPIALLLLASCDTLNQNNLSPDPGFGEAAKYDAAVQIIDPDPVYDANGAQPGDNGEKAAAAVKRYRTDQVKSVQVMATTSGSGSESGPK